MFKNTISLIVAGIAVVYILFANPAQAATLPATPAEAPLTSRLADQADANREAARPTTTRSQAHRHDIQSRRLLPASEIHRLLTIYASE